VPEDNSIARVAALGEPVRRALYEYVAEQGHEVSRDEAAGALGISRALAAFHLDRLADEHLLETTFRRLTGKAGPGAGRPSKLYRRTSQEVSVTLPPREYELAAQLLAVAIERSQSEETTEALRQVAAAFGARLAAMAASSTDEASPAERLMRVLTEHGYEPFLDEDGVVRLRNCPFHALSQTHTQLVCGMNLCLTEGLVEGLGIDGLEARLEPHQGLCCVAFHQTDSSPELPGQA
jgi:predicted ArsR family transcriptional regulator